jgi:hypothetical protein
MRAGLTSALALLAASAFATPGLAVAGAFEPRLFHVPNADEVEDPDEVFIDIHPEYRVRAIHIDPLDLSGVEVRAVSWFEQRLRVDSTFALPGVGGIFIQADILDGVLFGDNGRYGTQPEVNSGVGLASKQPNLSGWQMGLMDPERETDPEAYGPILRSIDPLRINFLYGEVRFPFGLLRIGRQPITETGAMAVNDGRSHRNRWGASYYHQAADRILFGTKISELFRMMLEGDSYIPDRSMERGVTLGLVYDFLVEDDLADFADDMHMVAMQLAWRCDDEAILGPLWHDIVTSVTLVYRWDERYGSKVFAVPVRAAFSVEKLDVFAEFSVITGESQEISSGFAELTGEAVKTQELLAYGARLTADYKVSDFTFTAQWGYASGDDDPSPSNAQTSTTWPRDTNLGLLLFEHVLAFQSARSAAIGIQALKERGADSFPLSEVATEGRVTNVNALFPQVAWEPFDGFQLQLGALFAWSASATVDPIQSLLRKDGQDIDDDLVNYNGGAPAHYWGTEFDVGVRYRYRQFFQVVLEAAYLLPGPGLQDENGDAVPAWMLETRFLFSL